MLTDAQVIIGYIPEGYDESFVYPGDTGFGTVEKNIEISEGVITCLESEGELVPTELDYAEATSEIWKNFVRFYLEDVGSPGLINEKDIGQCFNFFAAISDGREADTLIPENSTLLYCPGFNRDVFETDNCSEFPNNDYGDGKHFYVTFRMGSDENYRECLLLIKS
jgi:hypothetical protein